MNGGPRAAVSFGALPATGANLFESRPIAFAALFATKAQQYDVRET